MGTQRHRGSRCAVSLGPAAPWVSRQPAPLPHGPPHSGQRCFPESSVEAPQLTRRPAFPTWAHLEASHAATPRAPAAPSVAPLVEPPLPEPPRISPTPWIRRLRSPRGEPDGNGAVLVEGQGAHLSARCLCPPCPGLCRAPWKLDPSQRPETLQETHGPSLPSWLHVCVPQDLLFLQPKQYTTDTLKKQTGKSSVFY